MVRMVRLAVFVFAWGAVNSVRRQIDVEEHEANVDDNLMEDTTAGVGTDVQMSEVNVRREIEVEEHEANVDHNLMEDTTAGVGTDMQMSEVDSGMDQKSNDNLADDSEAVGEARDGGSNNASTSCGWTEYRCGRGHCAAHCALCPQARGESGCGTHDCLWVRRCAREAHRRPGYRPGRGWDDGCCVTRNR